MCTQASTSQEYNSNVHCRPSKIAYKATSPPSIKKWTRSGKIADTVATLHNNFITPNCSLYTISDPATAIDYFYDTILKVQDYFEPLKRKNLSQDKPWINKELKQKMLKCQKLYKQVEAEKRQVNKPIFNPLVIINTT
jgi:hypothetical protein